MPSTVAALFKQRAAAAIDLGVDEAGRQQAAGKIDRRHAFRQATRADDVDDLVAFDKNGCIPAARRAVKQFCAQIGGQARHGLFLRIRVGGMDSTASNARNQPLVLHLSLRERSTPEASG
ncbi:MAG: hypothetical protein P0Y66_19725 [Candidatus Kaistia colombiensis]|nr:MAG: hypothetical protein P0Y66_19725 [Kaistia sp.]